MSTMVEYDVTDDRVSVLDKAGKPALVLTAAEAAKLSVNIAQLLAFPWRNTSGVPQFCPRHPARLICAGCHCDQCAMSQADAERASPPGIWVVSNESDLCAVEALAPPGTRIITLDEARRASRTRTQP